MTENNNLPNGAEIPGMNDIPQKNPDIHVYRPFKGTPEIEVAEEDPKAIEDAENPLAGNSMKNMAQLIKQVGEMVKIMEAQWGSSKEEFKLTDNHMKLLYQYNEEHMTAMPDYLTDEEKDKWDHFNGLNDIPEEKVLEIFGEDHPIIGVMHTQTLDRIKDVTNEFFSWMTTLKEYSQINDAYLNLIETEEEANMSHLRAVMEKETDPEKKATLQASLDLYYNRKYLDFLAEPMDERTVKKLVEAFSDKNKITYWLNRSQDKLKQLKISTKIILEISQFEKRFLPEKYHKASNMLLLHFMQTVIYCNCGDKNDDGRTKAVCMVLTLDRVVRKTASKDVYDRVIENIMKFEENFLDKISDPVKPETDEVPLVES